MKKVLGAVKSFNNAKGYGFIVDEENNDCFFYFSSLNMDGFKTVKAGQKVKFVKTETEKGFRAEDVDII